MHGRASSSRTAHDFLQWKTASSYVDEHHETLRACCRDRARTDDGLRFSEQVAASGTEQRSNFFRILSRFFRTYSFDYAPRKRCYFISAQSHAILLVVGNGTPIRV